LLPSDKKNFASVVFKHICSVDYSIKLFKGTSLFGDTLQLEKWYTGRDNKKRRLGIGGQRGTLYHGSIK